MSWVIGCPDCGGTLLADPFDSFKDCPCGRDAIRVEEQLPDITYVDGVKREATNTSVGNGFGTRDYAPSPVLPSKRWVAKCPLVGGRACKLCVKEEGLCHVHDPDQGPSGGVPRHLPEEYHGAVEVEGDSLLPP